MLPLQGARVLSLVGGHKFDPWLGNKDPAGTGAAKEKKKERVGLVHMAGGGASYMEESSCRCTRRWG